MKEKIKKIFRKCFTAFEGLFKEEPPHPPTLSEFLWFIIIMGGILLVLMILRFVGIIQPYSN